MKSINFRQYNLPDKKSVYSLRKKYCFWLPGRFFYFGSERTCKAFMAECNDFFSLKLYTLNKLYPELFAEWRNLWMYEIDTKIENDIIKGFNDLEINLNKSSYHGKNSINNAWTYGAMLNSCDNMIELCRLFKSVHDLRSSTTLKKDMILLQIRISQIKTEMETYQGPQAKHLQPDEIKLINEKPTPQDMP